MDTIDSINIKFCSNSNTAYSFETVDICGANDDAERHRADLHYVVEWIKAPIFFRYVKRKREKVTP